MKGIQPPESFESLSLAYVNPGLQAFGISLITKQPPHLILCSGQSPATWPPILVTLSLWQVFTMSAVTPSISKPPAINCQPRSHRSLNQNHGEPAMPSLYQLFAMVSCLCIVKKAFGGLAEPEAMGGPSCSLTHNATVILLHHSHLPVMFNKL